MSFKEKKFTKNDIETSKETIIPQSLLNSSIINKSYSKPHNSYQKDTTNQDELNQIIEKRK